MPQFSISEMHSVSAAEGWLGLGDPASAAQELEALPAALQDHPTVMRLRWEIFSALRKWEAALEVATRLAKANPDDRHAWVSRSFALHELKRTAEARENLLSVLPRFPTDALMRYNLACYECQIGNHDAACKRLREAFALPDGEEFRATAMADTDLLPLRSLIQKL
jgi:predicted Zn-dependent protease